MSNPVINPGEQLNIEVYISGYGEIRGSKLVFYVSPEAVDENKSTYTCEIEKKGNLFVFGGKQKGLGDVGNTIDFCGGLRLDNWDHPTFFFDNPLNPQHGRTPQISTEAKLESAPIDIRLKTRRKLRPGPHEIQFVFSYFNGSSWATSTARALFTVRNLYQRHEGLVWGIGLIAALTGIILAFKDIIKFIVDCFFD